MQNLGAYKLAKSVNIDLGDERNAVKDRVEIGEAQPST